MTLRRILILKIKKNTFEKLCDKLEEKYLHNVDEITFVEKYIKENIGQERNQLLKIRAEAREDDYLSIKSIWISSIAILISLFSVAFQMLMGDCQNTIRAVIFIGYVILLSWAFLRINRVHQIDTVGVWRKYVLEVCDELLTAEDSITYLVKVKKQEEDEHDN